MARKGSEKVGKITVPKGRLVQEHELVVATVLSWTGDDVNFLVESSVRMPDIEYRRVLWEIKSPKGNSSRTIENNIRLAMKQSCNIIIDLHRIKRVEKQCIREIRYQAERSSGIKRLKVITRHNEIIEIKG